MIVFVQPTRGVTFTESVASIIREAEGQPILFTHDLPVPESFNSLREQALVYEPDYVFFVDEDVVLSPGITSRLIDLSSDIAIADYHLHKNKKSITWNGSDPLYGGMGCFLIKASALRQIGEFRTDTTYLLPDYRPQKVKAGGYGRQDVDYFMRAHELGLSVKALDETLRHLKVIKYGEHTNNGCHTIKDKGDL